LRPSYVEQVRRRINDALGAAEQIHGVFPTAFFEGGRALFGQRSRACPFFIGLCRNDGTGQTNPNHHEQHMTK
jgi:hypothetical protein